MEDVDIGTIGPTGLFHDGDCGKMVVHVVCGKGGKDRMIPVSTRLASILREYVRVRFNLEKTSASFFVTVRGDLPLSASAIRFVLNRLRKKVGFYFTAHALRHTFATLMLEGNCDLHTLSKLMGHTKMTTTAIYLASSPRLMASSMERHPLN